jgi:hypothetical protein
MSELIDKDEQLSALFTWQLPQRLTAVLGRPVWDVRRYVTFTRSDAETYLRNHPVVAADYFRKHSSSRAHDAPIIYEKGDHYIVAWSDHGTPRSERSFPTLIEAVAYHALIRHGMGG